MFQNTLISYLEGMMGREKRPFVYEENQGLKPFNSFPQGYKSSQLASCMSFTQHSIPMEALVRQSLQPWFCKWTVCTYCRGCCKVLKNY